MKTPFLLGGALLFSACANACLWDSDTLETEARGVPTAIKAISGRFERNPNLYYEMRLARVTRQIEKTPRDFNLYDDAAVAQSRLGKPEKALEWIEKKRAVLAPLNAHNKDDWYRYYANAGTFSMQKWLMNGANRLEMRDLACARFQIKRAIDINPNAHFGREKYQLGYIEWLLNPEVLKDTTAPIFWNPNDDPRGASKAVEGISGLVTEGLGWGNVDVFRALGAAMMFDEKRNYAGFLAFERGAELLETGKKSLDPEWEKTTLPEKLKAIHYDYPNEQFGSVRDEQQLKATFQKLRAEADNYHLARAKWMLQKLRAGQHPDTHSDFWNGFTELPAPTFAGNEISNGPRFSPALWMLALPLVATFFVLKKRRKLAG